MLFFVGIASTPPSSLNSRYDYYVFPDHSEMAQKDYSFSIVHSDQILDSLFASLRNKQPVIICNGPCPISLTPELEKNRLAIFPGKYLFLAPRATYFFNQLSANISINTYQEMEELAKSWGK